MSFSFPPPRPDRLLPALSTVADRRRPRLLLSAARHGMALYRRDRDLPRLTARTTGQTALDALTEAESCAEAARRNGEASYSFAAHIDLLVALLTEQRLDRQS